MARIIPATEIVVPLEDMTLDLVCFEHALSVLRDRRAAGRLNGYVEAVLDANPGLAATGAILPLGALVRLPEFRLDDESVQTVRLWD